jgi:hypothetical protein
MPSNGKISSAGHVPAAGVVNGASILSSSADTSAKLVSGVGAVSCTIGMLALAARLDKAAKRQRAARTARGAGVVTIDENGRARFATKNVDAAPSPDRDQPSQPLAPRVMKSTAIAADGTFNPIVLSQEGITAPFGVPGQSYWDPAGLSKDISEEKFRLYRTAELKHGRVAMLACAGLVAQHYTRFNFGDFTTQTEHSGAKALLEYPAGGGFGIFILLIGYLELVVLSDEGKAPGDYGDPLLFAEFSGKRTEQIRYPDSLNDDLKEFRNFELNHGRLAMWGFFIAIILEFKTGFDAVDQWSMVYPHLKMNTRPLSFEFLPPGVF